MTGDSQITESHPVGAGAGRSTIELPAWVYPLENFEGEHDPLGVRVLVLDDARVRMALAVVDITSLFEDTLDQVIEIIASASGAERSRVAVIPTHTFSAPHIPRATELLEPDGRRKTDELRRCLHRAARTAAKEAARSLRPAKIGFGSGFSSVNVNRDVLTANGWWLGANDAGPSDKTVGVIRIDDVSGAPIAILANYAVQSSVMNQSTGADGQRMVTADLAGAAMRHVEEQYGEETVAFFLIGAAGDQAPYLTAFRHPLDRHGNPAHADAGHAAFCLVALLGERLGAEIVRTSERIENMTSDARLAMAVETLTLPAQVAPRSLSDIEPNRTYRFRPNGNTTTVITVVQIGDIALAGVQPELSATTGAEIKRRSPFRHTFVVTMMNGGAKYMADDESYDKVTYAAMNSRFARGCAEILTDHLIALLTGLRGWTADAGTGGQRGQTEIGTGIAETLS